MRVAVIVVVLGLPAVAYADPPGMTTTVIPPSEPNAINDISHNDAGYDHALGYNSGIVLGRGDVDVTLLCALDQGSDLGVAVGIGAGIELTLDGIDALGGRFETLGLQAQIQLARGRRYAFSGSLGYHFASSPTGEAPFFGSYLSLGGDLAVAITDNSLLSFGVGILRSSDDDSPVAMTAHVDLAISRSWLRPIIELAYVGSPMAYVGLRFAFRHVSIDAGVGAVSSDITDGSNGLALVGLSIRP